MTISTLISQAVNIRKHRLAVYLSVMNVLEQNYCSAVMRAVLFSMIIAVQKEIGR